MKENFLHLTSSVPTLININGENVGSIDNKYSFEIDIITRRNNVFVTYSPISTNENYLPYSLNLDTKEMPKSNNDYAKIIPFPDNNYDIIFTPFTYLKNIDTEIILNTNVGKYFVSITSSNKSTITIFSGTSTVCIIHSEKLISAKCEQKNELLIIEGIINDSTYYLLIIDTENFQTLHNDISHSIEITSDYIQSLKKLNDISRHAQVCKIEFKSKKVETFYVFEDNNYHTPLSPLLIPYAFLECLKINDENTSRLYLDNKYTTTPIEKFKSYFGKFEDVYLNRHLVKQDKLNYTIKGTEYRNYNFIMKNDKIFDIEEICL